MSGGDQPWRDSYLQIGDEFALQTVPQRDASGKPCVGFVTAGSVDNTVFSDFLDGTDMERTNPPHPQNCRLMLHTTNQYTSSKKLRDFLMSSESYLDASEAGTKKLAAMLEQEHNEAEFRQRTGQMAVFGNIYQVLVPVSNKFVQAEKHIAKEDDTCLQTKQVGHETRSKLPWFRLMPGFATRNEGDRIKMGDTVILESIKMPKMYLHCAVDNANVDDRKEVNISSDATRFTVVPVAKYADAHRHPSVGIVRGGEFVQIYQRQSQAYVYRDSDGNPRMFRPPKERAEEQTTGVSVADRVSTRADLAWQLEVPSMKWSGSAVQNRSTTLFSLKDSMSGHFLHERPEGEGECFFHEGDDTAYAQWKLVPFDGDTTAFLYEKTPFMLKNSATGNLLHRGDAIIDEQKTIAQQKLKQAGGKRKASQVRGEILDEESLNMATAEEDELFYGLTTKPEAEIKEDDLFTFRPLSNEWVNEFRSVQQDMSKLIKFSNDLTDYGPEGKKLADGTIRDLQHGINVITRTHLRLDIDGFDEAPVIAVLTRFLMALTSSSNDDPLSRDGLLNKPLQRMFSEFRLVSFLLNVLDEKIFRFIDPVEIQNETHGTELLYAVKLIFRLLGQMCKHNSADSARVFSRLEDFMMKQLDYPWKAADVISQMFLGSEDLIRGIKPTFIKDIWELARKERQNTHVDFLCVLLVHDGVPIKENQDTLAAVIKKDLTSESSSPVFFGDPWPTSEHSDDGWAIPPDPPANSPQPQARRIIHGIERKRTIEPLSPEEKTWMKEFSFHVSFVKLAARLCCARHRASIDLFLTQSQFKFTYERVLNHIQHSWQQSQIKRLVDTVNLAEEARLRYTQLMLTLYVDREPFELRSPNQGIRILPFIKIDHLGLGDVQRVDPYMTKNGEPLRDVDGEPINPPIGPNGEFFGDLKQTILEVFKVDRERSGRDDSSVLRAFETKHNEFLTALVELAKQLLLCGIYDGGFDANAHSDGVLTLGPEAQDLASALLPVLDGRTDEVNEEQDERHPERSTRFYLSYENGILMDMKRKVLDMFDVLFGMRASTRIDELLKVFYKDDDGDGIADIIQKHDERLSSFHESPRNQRKRLEEEAEYEEDELEAHLQRIDADMASDTTKLETETRFRNPLAFEEESDPLSSPTANGCPPFEEENSRPVHTKRPLQVDSSAVLELDLKRGTQDAIVVGTDAVVRSIATAQSASSGMVVKSIETAQSATFAARKLAAKQRQRGDTHKAGDLIQQTAKLTKKTIEKVSIFKDRESTVELMTGILADLTRYNMDPKLAFKAFNTMILFLSQDFVFQKALRSVTPIGTNEDARSFLQAMAQVSEFRRLRKWLHDDEQCRECIIIVDDLTERCATKYGQVLLRNLNLEEYVTRVLKMRLKSKLFDKLVIKVLRLVEKFCDFNKDNQNMMAVHVEQIFIKLLHIGKYTDACAHCLRGVLNENAEQSAALSGMVVQHVSTLAMQFGRRLGLLSLLKALLVVDGEPVLTSQLKVCKGVMMSKDLIEVDGAVEQDEWAVGPPISRVEMLQTVIENQDGPDHKLVRCRMEAEYYCKSLDVLAECANGKNPTTELLCASVMPLAEIIQRLHEVYDHEKLQTTELDVAGIKNSTMAFFREVFVDTNSSHLLRAIRRPAIGIWTVNKYIHAEYAVPIATSLYKDLALVREDLPIAEMHAKTRVYVFEQVVQFFIQYACINELKAVPGDEIDRIVDMYDDVLKWATNVQQSSSFASCTTREKLLIQKLVEVCEAYTSGEVLDPDRSIDNIDREASQGDESPPQEMWTQVVDAVERQLMLDTVAGTNRTLGASILDVGKALWKTVPEERAADQKVGENKHAEEVHFAAFLVEPMLQKLEELQFEANKEALPDVLMMLDAVRSIPYGVTAFDEPTTKVAFANFMEVQPLDSSINPDVSRVQSIMVKQGWALLCFRILSMETLPTLRLPALRLLLALTGGGNRSVQNELLQSLDDPKVCPNEICATNFRRLLRDSVADLKLQRRSRDNLKDKEVGFALEVLQVIRNLTLGDHAGMQVYFQRQPGHPRELDIIADVVGYLSQLERYIKEAVAHTDDVGIILPRDQAMMDRAYAAFRVLISMCTGPNLDNQVAVALTDIISVVNRILYYCEYKFSDLQDTVTTDRRAKVKNFEYFSKGEAHKIVSKDRPRRKLTAQISRLLLTLLAGNPDQVVIQSVVGSLNWGLVARHLATLKLVMTEGYVPEEIAEADEKFVWSKNTKKRQFYAKGTQQAIGRLPEDARKASWMQEEAYKYITIFEQCYRAASSQDMKVKLDPVMEHPAMVDYFQSRLGTVEVVRNHTLERLYFWMPETYLNKDQRHRAERRLDKFLNAVDRSDDERKLRHFIDGAVEVVATIDQEESKQDDPLVRLKWHVDDWLPGNAVMFLSLVIVFVCVVAFDHRVYSNSSPWAAQDATSSVSHFVPWYGRLWDLDDLPVGFNVSECYPVDDDGDGPWLPPIPACRWPFFAWYLFVVVALVHLVVCALAFYVFLEVRVPVLLEHVDRQGRLAHLQKDVHHTHSDRIRFLSCSVHAYGFTEDIAEDKLIQMAFGVFGVVAVVRTVKVPGKFNSWAMVTFTDPKAVDVLKKSLIRESNDAAQANHAGDAAQASSKSDAGSEEGDADSEEVQQYVEIRTKGSHKDRVFIRIVTQEYIEESTTLNDLVDDAEFELLARSDEDVLYTLATAGQHILNVSLGRVGRAIPLQAMVVLRKNTELWSAVADIIFSIAGFFWSPLLFSYHLTKVSHSSASASIVVRSITTNWGRLLTTILLSMFALYLFAVSGLLLFDSEHASDGLRTGNEGGPCANLLTCVLSYSFSGLMQEGVGVWLKSPDFPEQPADLWDMRTARIVWEVVFMMVSSCAVIAIITGIICDTFGELRMQQDEAKAYRASTCFVTGIAFSRVPQEKSTHYLQYMYLLLYLRRLHNSELMPLELMVRDQVNRGDVRWMPNQRCLTLESMEEGNAQLEKNLLEMQETVNEVSSKLTEMDEAQGELRAMLSAMHNN